MTFLDLCAIILSPTILSLPSFRPGFLSTLNAVRFVGVRIRLGGGIATVAVAVAVTVTLTVFVVDRFLG